MTKAVVWLVAGLTLATIVFSVAPGLDIAVSRLFAEDARFPIADNTLIEAVRKGLYSVEDAAGILALLTAALAHHLRRDVLRQAARVWLFQGLVFVAGPLLLVNGILKPLWSRPRPFRITAFGGAEPFQPIYQIAGTCTHNCSFTSGEMAGATALTIMAVMLARANRDRLAGLYSLALGLAILPMPFTAWQRIAAGRHFLSDITFSALCVALFAVLLAKAMRLNRRTPPVDSIRDSPY